jgi:hypothetical protein
MANVLNKTALASLAASAQVIPAAATRPLHILLAEDSPDNRLLIAAYFKRFPYQVDTAEDGKVASRKIHLRPLRLDSDGHPDARDGRLRGHADHPRLGD